MFNIWKILIFMCIIAQAVQDLSLRDLSYVDRIRMDSHEQYSNINLPDMAAMYEDDKNAMIALSEPKNDAYYDYFYEELDNEMKIEQSMNVIFFGPPSSFLRLDAETVLHLLMVTKKHLIPRTRALLAWDIITDGKTAAFLRAREFKGFGTLLNYVPEEDLYTVNFGDQGVLNFFATFDLLEPRKYGVLVSAYMQYYGKVWNQNGTYINEMGYLICGIPSYDLTNISPAVFKEINIDFMSSLKKCYPDQMETLYKIAIHPDAYNAPYKWSTFEITRLDLLFICISKHDIGSLRLEAVQAISRNVMKKIKQEKLLYFTEEQIYCMNRKARRIFFLRIQLMRSMDMNKFSKGSEQRVSLFFPITFNFVIVLYLK